MEDVDGDGMLEAFATVSQGGGPWQLWGFDPPPGLQGLWDRYLIDAHCNCGGHDIFAVADVNGNGRADIVLGEEVLDYPHRTTPWSRLAWFEHPADPRQPWAMHVIDTVRCAYSIAVADLDGELEVVAGEHDPFKPYRSRCRALIYKKPVHGAALGCAEILRLRFASLRMAVNII